jgi:hypothetical protein
MDIERLDINAVCLGILCNFTPVCGEDRAEEAAGLVRTLQSENEKLRVLAELGNTRAKDYRVMRDRAVKAESENEQLRAELEQVKRCIEIVENQRDQMKRERDAAVEDLHKLCPAWKWDGEEG